MSTLIVDDNEDMRLLVRMLIDLTDGEAAVVEAADGREGFELWRQHRPDVVVLDHRLPDGPGIDVAERIVAEDPTVSVLLFSAFLDDGALDRAEQLGIRWVPKDQVRTLPGLVLEGRRS